MTFTLIHETKLSRESYNTHLAWAQYYEPSDIDTLAALGFDRSLVEQKISSTGWSDEYWFPIPAGAPRGSFQFEYRKGVFTVPNGNRYNGYVVNEGHAVCLFGKKEDWIINLSLLDLLDGELVELKKDLALVEADNVLPLRVDVPFDKTKFIFCDERS
jgi:hypothetical protein